MFGGNSSSMRTFDRMLGFFVTIGFGLALVASKNWLRDTLNKAKSERDKKKRNNKREIKGEKGDESFEARYRAAEVLQAVHSGSCHCDRIRFRIQAPRTINAIDIPSKIRFPRVSIPVDYFEPLTDDNVMSMYATRVVMPSNPDNSMFAGLTGGSPSRPSGPNVPGVGIHTFCSYCGVHVLFSPSTEPTELQINVDCLERTNIDKISVTYYATTDSIPVPLSYEHAKPFNRRGSGAMYSPCSAIPAAMFQKHQGQSQGQSPSSTYINSSALVTAPALDHGSHGSFYDKQNTHTHVHARFSSPPSKGKGLRARSSTFGSSSGLGLTKTPQSSGRKQQYGMGYDRDREPLSSPMNKTGQGQQRFMSPFTKTKNMQQKEIHDSRISDDACDNYLQSLQFYNSHSESDGRLNGQGDENENNYQGQGQGQGYDDEGMGYLGYEGYEGANQDQGYDQLGYGFGHGQEQGQGYNNAGGEQESLSMLEEVNQMASGSFPAASPSPSPFKFRSFSERTGNMGGVTAGLVGLGGMGLSFSPGAMSKQLDSMKQHLSKYEDEVEVEVPQYFKKHVPSN